MAYASPSSWSASVMMTSASLRASMIRLPGRLVGGRAHVEEEEGRHVARLAHARAVEPGGGRAAGAHVDARVDGRVQVEVLAVLETADGAVHLGADALELAAHLGQQARVVGERLAEELARVAREADLREPAPAAAVVADQVVPLVVEESVVVVRGD